MQVHDFLFESIFAWSSVHALALLAALPAQSVQTQQIPVAGLHDVLLAIVSVELAQLGEVAGVGDGGPDILLAIA